MSRRWKTLPLSAAPVQIVDGDRGKNYPKLTELFESGYCLFLNAGNVTPDGFKFSKCQFIDEDKDQALRKGRLSRGDVVMTTRGTIGNVAYFDENVLLDNIRINSGMVIFRTAPNELSPAFLYHFLRSPDFEGQTRSLKSGVAQPQLPIRDIKRIHVPLPDLATQQRVADILCAYDDLIENNRRRMALLEDAARQLYREWFVGLRFPGHEHTRITNGVPQGWEKGCVGDFYDTASGGTPSRKNSEYFTGEIPWVKTQELSNGFIIDTEEKITEDALANSSAKLFPDQTVLIALYGATVGELGILSLPAATNQACCAVFPKDPRTHYIHAFLFFRENKEELVSLSAGAAQKNISQQIVRAFEMVMPAKSLMEAFVDSLSTAFELWLNLQRSNDKLRAARDLLLPRLMSGELAAG